MTQLVLFTLEAKEVPKSPEPWTDLVERMLAVGNVWAAELRLAVAKLKGAERVAAEEEVKRLIRRLKSK